MPKRIKEEHEQAIVGMESARAYAKEAKSPMMRMGYGVIARRISRLGVKGKYLEIGSGPAVLTTIVAQAIPEAHVTAVELSPAMITVAKEQVESEGLTDRISFVEGDATDARSLDQLGRFDLVYSTYSLHHWDHPETVIENLLQAIAPVGILFIHDLKRVWWLYWIPTQRGLIPSIRAAYTTAEIRELLTRVGVDRYEIKNGPFYQSIIVRT
jgi:2-polyprenyl-3-methyl-5-hydroxy-6-metoxy-1,4-benzoquinol methylase